MLSLLAGLMIAGMGQDPASDQPAAMMLPMKDSAGVARMTLRKALIPLDPIKTSPKEFTLPSGRKTKFQFPWITSAFGRQNGETDMRLRTRVYSQERGGPDPYDLATLVARMAVRLWDYSLNRLKIDQPLVNELGLVDFYLCWGGTPGGEQLRGEDLDGLGRRYQVNTIYIYDLATFSEPVEMAREVAHEYGHAILPAVGGFETPEDWANGYLGERIFLRWLAKDVSSKALHPLDSMGASGEALSAWVKTNVDPLVKAVSLSGPDGKVLRSKGQTAMDMYMGLALYAEDLFGSNLLGRAMKLNGATRPADFPGSLVQAVSEKPQWTIKPLAGPFWIPVGKGKVVGATVVKQVGDWAQIEAKGPVTLKFPE